MGDLTGRMRKKIADLFENKCRLVREMEQETDARMRLTAELARARDALEALAAAKTEFDALKAENEKLRETLSFYKNSGGYTAPRGQRARTAFNRTQGK